MTDDKDQRCLRSILKIFFQPTTLEPDYKYSPSGKADNLNILAYQKRELIFKLLPVE